jgi:hypothetical protein
MVEPSSLLDCMGFVVGGCRDCVDVDLMSSRALSIRQDCGLRHGWIDEEVCGDDQEGRRCTRTKK